MGPLLGGIGVVICGLISSITMAMVEVTVMALESLLIPSPVPPSRDVDSFWFGSS